MMGGSHLIVRADANTEIGSGHLLRCLALAQAWREQGGRVHFVSCCANEKLRCRVENAGFELTPLLRAYPHPDDLNTTLEVASGLPGVWLVIDGYHFDADYQEAALAGGIRTLVIDDNAHLPVYRATALLNQNLHAETLPYRMDAQTIAMLGTHFVLLRPEFAAWKDCIPEIRSEAHRILVTLGGSDPHNVTERVIEALGLIEIEYLEARILVGAANPYRHLLERAAQSMSRKICLLKAVTNMPEQMSWADVAVCGGGSTCWELAFMGLPAVLIVLAENQRQIAGSLDAYGAAIDLGWHEAVAPRHIAAALTDLLAAPERRLALRRRVQHLVDGAGAARVVKRLM